VSSLVRAAFRALSESQGPGYWQDVATVAAVLRESGDQGVDQLLSPPLGDQEAWDRLQAVAAELDAGLIALDLKTEFLNPDAHTALRTDPEGEEDS